MNELIAANSTYLKQHSKNPVNWFPWSNNALRLAKEEDKFHTELTKNHAKNLDDKRKTALRGG